MKYLLVAFLLVGSLWASNFDKGLEAYNNKNYMNAITYYKLSENAGAQYNLGLIYEYGKGVKKNYKEALKWYILSAKQGYPSAQYNVGFMYHSGKGTEQNYKEALKWYELSAKQGKAKAMNNLGHMYLEGNGVLQDYKKAEKYFKQAIKNKLSFSKCNLGVIYAEQGKISKAKAIVKEGYNEGEDYCKTIWNKYELGKK